MNLNQLIEKLTEAGRHPGQTVTQAVVDSGRRAVGCFPVFTPDELIHAAGFLPVGMWGGDTAFQRADRYLQSFACSVMRANLELGICGIYEPLSAVLVPTLCDTLKCMCENWKIAVPGIPVIGVTYPQNRTLPAARKQLLAEYESIRAQLAKLAGAEVTDAALEQSLAVYEAYRAVMNRFADAAAAHPATIGPKARHYIIKASYFMEKGAYTALMEELCAGLEALPEETTDGLRVVVTGVMADAEPLLDLLEELNVAVADDLMLHESVQFRTRAGESGTALERMVDRILNVKGCSVFFEPGKSRGRMLAELAGKRRADAVLFLLMKFCDPEEFDYPLVKRALDESGVRSLQIETDQQVDTAEQLRTRLQSFAEMVR